MLRIRLALGVSAMVGALALPAAALAVPGDRAIDDPAPGVFRLDDDHLEPGCFVPHRRSTVEIDDHLVIGVDSLTEEAHVTVEDGAWFSVDTVLVPSPIDGYKVVHNFDTGTINNDPDIDPNQTATGLKSPTRFVDARDLIVCVSGHGDAAQNDPYNQEDGGLVSAKNRPIVAPTVTALGASAIDPLNTYKLGFGYEIEQWYERAGYQTSEDGNGLFPSVSDPNAFPSPTFGDDLPLFVGMKPRPADFPYDARRVNDVDKNGEHWAFPSPDADQTLFFSRTGDDSAWLEDNEAPGRDIGLLTFLTRGDFPVSWTLRPSLASPDSLRTVEFTNEMFDEWEQGWQDYYCGKGPHPTLPLPPGSNSPDPRDCPIIVNPPEVVPPATVIQPAPVAAPVINVVGTPAPAVAPTTTKKGANAKQKKAYRKCVRQAKAKSSRKAVRRAKSRCARMPH